MTKLSEIIIILILTQMSCQNGKKRGLGMILQINNNFFKSLQNYMNEENFKKYFLNKLITMKPYSIDLYKYGQDTEIDVTKIRRFNFEVRNLLVKKIGHIDFTITSKNKMQLKLKDLTLAARTFLQFIFMRNNVSNLLLYLSVKELVLELEFAESSVNVLKPQFKVTKTDIEIDQTQELKLKVLLQSGTEIMGVDSIANLLGLKKKLVPKIMIMLKGMLSSLISYFMNKAVDESLQTVYSFGEKEDMFLVLNNIRKPRIGGNRNKRIQMYFESAFLQETNIAQKIKLQRKKLEEMKQSSFKSNFQQELNIYNNEMSKQMNELNNKFEGVEGFTQNAAITINLQKGLFEQILNNLEGLIDMSALKESEFIF